MKKVYESQELTTLQLLAHNLINEAIRDELREKYPEREYGLGSISMVEDDNIYFCCLFPYREMVDYSSDYFEEDTSFEYMSITQITGRLYSNGEVHIIDVGEPPTTYTISD